PSGAGKSSILKLIYGNYRCDEGQILVRQGDAIIDIASAPPRQILSVRQRALGYVTQFLRAVPRVSALDIVAEPLVMRSVPREIATVRAADILRRFNVPERLWSLPPATFSGGEQQRINLARGLLPEHPILLLDEPTASLDASIKGVILDLLMALVRDTGASLVIMSHDLRMVARRCARILVMYGGRVVETGDSREVFSAPRHPYTQALVRAAAGNEGPGGRLEPIPGVPPVLHRRSADCAFASRCVHAQPICRRERPADVAVEGRVVACHFALGGLPIPVAVEEGT
ncbi:MAG TPA: oligopeptide/dipeptide ABC transporter ATP-binding protein, partial [Caldimonas sp.]|nr:oligopeptide/dipeptide ABC transporter ATP-binding protein [Caldimonas sp.]